MKRFKKTFCDSNVLNFHLFIWCGNWALTSLRARMVHKTELKFDPYSYMKVMKVNLAAKLKRGRGMLGIYQIWNQVYTKKNKFNLTS